MARNTLTAIRELCLAFPGTEETRSHGAPDFRAGGKSFAILRVNHHGDGRVALWLQAPAGAQQLYTEMEPEDYFVPPYVGSRGWLGMELNKNLAWTTIALRVREAWESVASADVRARLEETPAIAPPDVPLSEEEINPFLRPRCREVMTRLGDICDTLPETSTTEQFGNPVFKVGKKTFISSSCYEGRLKLQFWVGQDQQALLTYDERYSIPAYTGHNGWIDLDVEEHADWDEIEQLLMNSYRHFALKRMLKALGD
ncbi:MAG: MmcQ/YjbR family DNA-binding protein [Halieaceae bacterium]|nr:MmcQ/YjbR family DNA-binding protein [Halieaceae bacterium]